MRDTFQIVGIRPQAAVTPEKRLSSRGKPPASLAVLAVVVLGCLGCEIIAPGDPAYMDLAHCAASPCAAFPLGTDTMGRDIFTMLLHGGRVSLGVGVLAAALSTAVALLLGALAGWLPHWADGLMLRGMEIFLSVPGLLMVVLLQALLEADTVVGLALVLGLTGWVSMAGVVRTEVRQLRSSEFVAAARCMGGGFFHILCRHLLPELLPSIAYMAVMSLRSAMIAESTLSFMGLGLPVETVSWGSMLSLAENALLTGAWWVIVVPGVCLVVTLLCVTELGEYLRRRSADRA